MKKVIIIDPYYADSHRYWAETLEEHLHAEVTIFSNSPVHWKWRMEGAAIACAQEVEDKGLVPDVFLVTDFLNLALFKSLLPSKYLTSRFVLYMHENQLTYPQSLRDTDKSQNRDNHYGFINYTSCLLADSIAFNSQYHQTSFMNGLAKLSNQLPDRLAVSEIESKSVVIPLTMEQRIRTSDKRASSKLKTVVWNHRWEYDKSPEAFLEGMVDLKNKGYEFRLVLLGKMNSTAVEEYDRFFKELHPQIDHIGYVSSKTKYYQLLEHADIIASTSVHDFFGISILEGLMAGCRPVLPKDLAYPELIPNSLWETTLYMRGSFVRAMERAVKEDWSTDNELNLKNHLKQFSWAHNKHKYAEWMAI